MANLNVNFNEYHNDVVKATKQSIKDKVTEKRDNIKKAIRDNLPELFEEEYGEELKKINFIHQGSYALDTVIEGNSKDIDLGVIITPHEDFDIDGDTLPLKRAVKAAIDTTNRVSDINKPCITVTYTERGEEDFHLDFPVYIKLGDKYYLAWGKPSQSIEERTFQESDPIALNEWFFNHLTSYDNLENLEKEKKAQTRRLVRILKYWKYLNYDNVRNTREVPPSIALTILACKNYAPKYYNEELNDLRTLHHVVDKMWKTLFNSEDETSISSCLLPVTPETDTLYKLRTNKESIKKFRKKLAKLRDKLKEAIDEESEKKAAEILAADKILGEEFPILEENTKANEKGDNFA